MYFIMCGWGNLGTGQHNASQIYISQKDALVQAGPASPILHLGWHGYAQAPTQSVYCLSNSILLWAPYLAPRHTHSLTRWEQSTVCLLQILLEARRQSSTHRLLTQKGRALERETNVVGENYKLRNSGDWDWKVKVGASNVKKRHWFFLCFGMEKGLEVWRCHDQSEFLGQSVSLGRLLFLWTVLWNMSEVNACTTLIFGLPGSIMSTLYSVYQYVWYCYTIDSLWYHSDILQVFPF